MAGGEQVASNGSGILQSADRESGLLFVIFVGVLGLVTLLDISAYSVLVRRSSLLFAVTLLKCCLGLPAVVKPSSALLLMLVVLDVSVI